MRLSSSAVVLLLVCPLCAVGLRAAPEPVQSLKTSLGVKLVYIPPGKFMMGSPGSEPGREAQEVQHEVELTKGFYLGTCEVTVGQFKQFVKDTKYETDGERDGKGAYGIDAVGKIEQMQAKFTWKSPGFEQTDDHPVVCVSWGDAKAFCKWLSEKEKKTYRLPTEAEWEFACRAGIKTAYAHGDDTEGLAAFGNGADATARAKFPGWSIGIKAKDGHVFTAPVGQFKANAFGLYDMHGNVWEWCEDWYEPNSYPKEKQVDPTGPATGKAKVQRGGGWSSDSKRLRSAARVGRDASAYRGCYLGFRVVLEQQSEAPAREPEGVKKPPAGLRVMFNGNSWANFVPGGVAEQVKAAGIDGHKEVKAAKPNDLSLIESGEVDVYSHGVHWWTEPINEAEKVLTPGLKANPNFRVYYHAAWLVGDGRAKEIKTRADYDDSKLADVQAALDKTRKGVEAKADELNKKYGKPVVFLVPVGDATVKLRALVLEGKYPGVTKQSDLWNDAMPHAGVHVMALSGYCHFAAIYRTSPVGLKISRFKELTDEQHAILQKIAWETVSKYPYAGVSKAIAKAGEPKAAPPSTLRMWHVGNSWSVPFPFEMVGLDRPFVLHTHNFGNKVKNWVEESLETDKKNVLVKGDFDVIYLGFVQLSLPVEALDQMTTLALKYKPDCRIYLQHAWATSGRIWALRDDDDLAAIQVEWDKRRKKLEDKVDEINKQHGKQVVFIIPLADAVMKMRQMVAAGKLPGVTKQSQLFWDNNETKNRDDHAAHQTVVLAMYCAHAAIYRKSPEGLKVSSPDGFYWGPKADKGKVPVNDAQHAILQKLAWETVSKYPYAGVTKAK